MDLGLHLSNFTWPGGPATFVADLGQAATLAEDVGFTKLSVMDHVWQIRGVGPAEHEMLEAYTTLGYLAAKTERIELLAWVTAAIYREPGLLAKAVTTLDVLSGGRAWLGIGAGWNEEECLGLGLPFPSTAERFERLEETLQICLQMWSDDDGPYRGRHYQLEETLCRPAPVSTPRPRIMIGGSGERKTLRLVAQYADACNIFGDPEEVAQKLDVLRRHCDDVGRDPSAIEVTAMFRDFSADTTAGDLVRGAEEFAAIGVSTLVTGAAGDDPAGWLESTFGPVIDEIHHIQAVRL
jgi:F420-dependent oxidoreductase-like protein